MVVFKVSQNLNTLYIGIDVSKESNYVYITNFNQSFKKSFNTLNNIHGAEMIETKLLEILDGKEYTDIVCVLESTGIYSAHIATYLSNSFALLRYRILVYCINPKISRNYRASFSDMDKTDPKDSYILADIARVGRTKDLHPFKGSQKLALQRLTRHRVHLAELLTKEKTYALTNIYLKFSEFGKSDYTFTANKWSNTALSVLEEYSSPEEIINTSLEDLVDFIITVSKNKFANPSNVAKLIKKAARASYRLDQVAYEPINHAISSSLILIRTYDAEIKKVNKSIEDLLKGFNLPEYLSLRSIPGIGPVFAAGILSEIGSVHQFKGEESIAKYAGITWRKNQSGNFEADDTKMTKTGNQYLRYYLIEAANSVKNYIPTYSTYYHKKFNEVTNHQHKRALALTARKLIRLIYGLMSKGQLFNKNY
ncbi:MAG: IS110 family transposase [Candidatus Izemoplasmataceae bacterium]